MREGGLWRNAGNDGDESRALGYCCTLLRGEWEPPIAFFVFYNVSTPSAATKEYIWRGEGNEGGWGTKTRSGLLLRRAATGGEEKTRVACGPGPRPFGP